MKRTTRLASRKPITTLGCPVVFCVERCVEAILQRYSYPLALYSESLDPEERFGKAKFGEQWVGRQTDSDSSLLARVRDLNRDYQSFGSEDANERRAPNYGPPSSALDRALRRKRMLAVVREDLSLLKDHDNSPNPALSL